MISVIMLVVALLGITYSGFIAGYVCALSRNGGRVSKALLLVHQFSTERNINDYV